MIGKTFHSINAIKKFYFPKEYRKEMEEKAIEKIGIGLWLAKRFCAEVKAVIKQSSVGG